MTAMRYGALNLLIASFLEAEHVDRIRLVDPRLNVLVSPHSASTSDRENSRLTDLFCENLRRFLAGRPLLNTLDLEER